MELAVNMFTGGMVLDSHPLVQSSDTLSDALNATYITMNGNEVVLLNDMGNRRVDNAFLPAGYEPVGIKEHGGIIYIAAYNPITHRSQIGSFPSPERNMGTEYKDNGTKFNFSNFISENNILTVNGVKFLKDDILLFPLTKDTSLHAGDKFTVYSDYIWNYSHLITNFGTEDENGIYKYNKTPFNSYFTLSLGVINSLNEFSDITSTLERFDSSGNIIKNLKSNEDKFNTGYFIAPGSWENNVNNGLTNEDATLLENRGKIGANTYAYKLTGPLYLKVQLNHILTFSYVINMSKVMTTLNQFTINLYITGTAVYNCPDSGEINGLAYFDSFKLLYKNLGNPYGNYENIMEGDIISKEPRVYDSITGLYTSSITKLFLLLGLSLENFNPNNLFLNYLIAVPIFHPSKNNIIEAGLDEQIYLSNLSEAGSIDISKIGTNSCELGMWKYKNNISGGKIISTLLDYRFNCYTDLITSFRNLTITLYNQTTTSLKEIKLNDLVSIPNEISTGRLSILINWEDIKEEKFRINFLDLYLAEIKYTQHSESLGNVLDLKIVLYRFILGTDLFNNCYEESNEDDYAIDFGIFMGKEIDNYYQYEYNNSLKKITPATTEGDKLRNKYLLVDLDTISNPVLTVRKYPNSLPSQTGSPIIESNETVPENLEKSYVQQVTINCASEWKLKNKEKYPKGISLLNLGIKIKFDDSDINKEFISEISCSEDLVLNINIFKEDIVTISNITTQDNKCIFYLNLKDKIKTTFEELTRIIGKAYFNLNSNNSLYRSWIYNIMFKNLVYSNLRLLVNLNFHAGYSDYINSLNPYGPQSSLQLGSEFWGIDEYTGGSVWVSWFENGKVALYDDYNVQPGDEWNSWKEMFKKMKCPFTFGFTAYNENFKFNINYYTDDKYVLSYSHDPHFGAPVNNSIDINYYPAVNYTRVWWTDEDGNPCLLNNFNYNEADYEDELHLGHGKPGLFYAGGYELNDSKRIQEVYSGILKYLGNIKNNEDTIYYLVVPIENISYKAKYPVSDSYIYFENPKVNLNVTVNYNLVTNDLSKISNNGCLFFNLPNSLSKSKELSTVININNDFSLSIIEMMLNSNLSSFSIDMEQKKVLSTEDPLKYLYVRKVWDNSQLKVVPINYPLQINEGVNNAFPIVCRKKYSSTQNKIGNRYLVVPWSGRWGDTNNWVDEGDIGFRTWGILDVHSQNIPVLFLEDLLNPIVNLFN